MIHTMRRPRPDETARFVAYRLLDGCQLWVEVCRSPAPTVALCEAMRLCPRGTIRVAPVGPTGN